jgi:hypothetical protein
MRLPDCRPIHPKAEYQGERVVASVGGLQRNLSRRRFLAASAGMAGVLALGAAECHPAIERRVKQADARLVSHHGVWIWQFSIDGSATEIADTLALYGLSAIVKTHDGVEWMATYDDADGAIAGPADIETVAATFEDAGVPFHAWCVVKGSDPVREAEMAAQVLAAGARTLTLDLEGDPSFWQGSRDDAIAYGYELRARNEFARIDVSIDPRPWKMLEIPLPEFVEFTDGIRPQMYWDIFDDEDHVRAYEYFGFPPPGGSITPEFLVDATHELLRPFDRWILPIGSGDPLYADAWPRFLARCHERDLREVSAWRYGTTTGAVLDSLASAPP